MRDRYEEPGKPGGLPLREEGRWRGRRPVGAEQFEADRENDRLRGEVVLRGIVASRREKHLAEQCIEDLPGVVDVRNELRVQISSGARPASPGASDATQSPSRRERGETAYS
jgi:hypothetical protein